MRWARVGALAVDDHRAGQHQAAHAGAGHRGEQHRGAEVVAADVLGQVVEVDAQADHRGLVHDRVDAAQRGARPRAGSRRSPTGTRESCTIRRRRAAVRGRMPAVEDGHLVPGRDQGRGDMGADESGPAGHEDMGHGLDRRLLPAVAGRAAPVRQRFVRICGTSAFGKTVRSGGHRPGRG